MLACRIGWAALAACLCKLIIISTASSMVCPPAHLPTCPIYPSAALRFNPEMMNKYAEVGQKIQALQEELGQTEVECATNEGKIVVKVSD